MKNIVCYKSGEKGHIAAKCSTLTEQSKQSKDLTLLAAADTHTLNNTMFCIDSGATIHLCCDKCMFASLNDHKEEVALAGETSLFAEGIGEVCLKTKENNIVFKNVLYVPNMRGNYISVGRAVTNGWEVKFGSTFGEIKRNGETLLRGKLTNNLYIVEGNVNSCFSSVQNESILWHDRYGHLNYSYLRDLASKGMVNGVSGKSMV